MTEEEAFYEKFWGGPQQKPGENRNSPISVFGVPVQWVESLSKVELWSMSAAGEPIVDEPIIVEGVLEKSHDE